MKSDPPAAPDVAQLAGQPAQQPTQQPAQRPVLPTRDDETVAASSEGVGGVAGRRVRPGTGWWTPVRIALAVAVLVCAAGYLSKDYCRDRAWIRGDGVGYVQMCYSDLPHLYRERGLAAGIVPYFSELPEGVPPIEYPVLTGAFMGVTAAATRALSAVDDSDDALRLYVDLNVILLIAFAQVTVIVTARLAGHRPWDAMIVAASPSLALAAFINWDLIAVALTMLAMLAWARRRPGLAGVLLGLGVATKLYPLFLLGPLFLLCWRAGQMRHFVRVTLMAIVTWQLVNLPVMLFAADGWAQFYLMNRDRGPDFGSIWYALEGEGITWASTLVNPLSLVTFGLGCLGIAVLALAAPRRPRFAQLAFLVVAAFLLSNKVYSPQYVLWLLPLAALARPRWRDIVIWQIGEVFYFGAVWLYLASLNDDRGLDIDIYWAAIWVRVACTGWLVLMVVRDVLRPRDDPVRAGGVDDPTGGLLDGARDVRMLRLPVRRRRPGRHAAVGAASAPDAPERDGPDREALDRAER